jgi:hypothetical protein
MSADRQLLINMMSFEFVKDNLFEETSRDPNRRLIVKGILQRAGVKNQNGRVYPKDVLVRESKKYEENFIKERRALGELDHPESAVVNLQNVSHNVLETHWEGDDLVGSVEVLPTPNGNILKELFRANIRLGISSRGLGTIKKGMNEEADFVQDDFELIAFDFVSNPSTRGAFMFASGNLSEGVNPNVVKNPITNKWELVENITRDILSEIN